MRIGIDNMLEVKEKRGALSSEKSFEKYFKSILEYDFDVKTFKLTGHKGIPDRFVFPNHFIELKVVTVRKDDAKLHIHKNWRRDQKRWAAHVHDQGARAWLCVLIQVMNSYKTHFYLEPAVYSIWMHENRNYTIDSYYKNLLMCRGKNREEVGAHIWQRLIEGDYYERTFARFSKEGTPLSEDVYAFKSNTPRMAP